MSQPSLRGRVVLKFPANVVAGYGIIIDKTNSTYTFSVDPAILGDGGGGGGGGIPEAPNDGQQYGRQSLAWTVIVPGGGGTGTITNPLLIEKGAQPQIGIIGTVGGLNRWRVNLGDSEAETGIAGGSDFHIESYNNDGTYRNLVIHADRDTSEVTITAGPTPHHAILSLNKLADGQACTFQGKREGTLRWGMALGDGVVESTLGDNSGSDFRINSYDDGGGFINAPFMIERATSKATFTSPGTPNVPTVAINKLTTSGGSCTVMGQTQGVARWQLSLGDILGEAVGPGGVPIPTSSSGSDLRINRYRNDGAFLDAPFWIRRDTGTLTLTGAHPAQEAFLAINKTTGGLANTIQGQTGLLKRWDLVLGDATPETGVAVGSDLRIHRYNNSGAFIDVPLWIRRDTGETVLQGAPPDQHGMLVINKISGAGGQASAIQGATATKTRWHLALGDGGAELFGTNTGSDFRVHRHDDNGNFITAAMYIKRDDGFFAVYGEAYKPTGAAWSTVSDSRIKTVSADYTQGLDAINALRPVKFTYKGNDIRFSDIPVSTAVPAPAPGEPDQRSEHYGVAISGQEFVGLVAQEAEIVMPELVTQVVGKIDGVAVTDMRAMDSSALIYALVNAVKELSARVEALEAGP